MKYSYLVSGLNNEAKKWSFDGALSDIKQAIAIQDLPIYTQLEGDIHYLKQDYNSALASYKKVNESNIRSASTIFTPFHSQSFLNISLISNLLSS